MIETDYLQFTETDLMRHLSKRAMKFKNVDELKAHVETMPEPEGETLLEVQRERDEAREALRRLDAIYRSDLDDPPPRPEWLTKHLPNSPVLASEERGLRATDGSELK